MHGVPMEQWAWRRMPRVHHTLGPAAWSPEHLGAQKSLQRKSGTLPPCISPDRLAIPMRAGMADSF